MGRKLTFAELKDRRITTSMYNDVRHKGACYDFCSWYERTAAKRPVTFGKILHANARGQRVGGEWLHWGLEQGAFPNTWVTAMCGANNKVVLNALLQNIALLTSRQIDQVLGMLGLRKNLEVVADNIHLFLHLSDYRPSQVIKIFRLVAQLDEDPRDLFYSDLYHLPPLDPRSTREMIELAQEVPTMYRESILSHVLANGSVKPEMLDGVDLSEVGPHVLFGVHAAEHEPELVARYLGALDTLCLTDRVKRYSVLASYVTTRKAGDQIAHHTQELPTTIYTDLVYRHLAESRTLSARQAAKVVGLRNVSVRTIYKVARRYKDSRFVQVALRGLGHIAPDDLGQ